MKEGKRERGRLRSWEKGTGENTLEGEKGKEERTFRKLRKTKGRK